jgi:hypothetical protein
MQISNPHPRRLPTDEELKHCVSVIGNIDGQIIQIKERIKDLQMQMEALKDNRMNHVSFISPIRCLPPKLLREICETCVEMGVNPLTLNQICGRFREIVNDTDEIWSRIRVTDGWPEVNRGTPPSCWDNMKVNLCHHYPD